MDAATHPKESPRTPRSLFQRLGVRWRLLLAFFGISAFAVIAAAAAMYSFAEVGKLLERITQERVPPALASLELSRQAERVVTAAPAFLAATTRERHKEVSQTIAAEVERLDELLGDLRGSAIAPGVVAAVQPAIDGLRRNLAALDALVASRLEVAERREELLRKLSGTNIAAQRLVAPGVLVMDSKLAEYRRATGDGPGEEAGRAAASQLANEVAVFMPQQKAQIELSSINEALTKAADAESPADLPLLAFPLRRSLATLEALASEFDDKLRARLLERVGEFRSFMEGPDSILEARTQELTIIARAEGLLAENIILSRQVGDALDRLVSAANQDIGAASKEARAAQGLGTGVLIGTVLLSLVSSGLIVWLYVQRNLVRRLTALSGSMLAVAGGNLRVPLPPPDGGDEIAEMARALTVFRDTAVEVEEKNLRELYALLDTIDYGVLLLEPDFRVRIYNRAYRQMWDMPQELMAQRPSFGEVLDYNRHRGIYEVPDDEWDNYVRHRIEELKQPAVTRSEWRLPSGRVLEYQCVPLPDGGRMLTYYDLTNLKRTEEALKAAKEEAEQASRTKSEFLANMSHELRTPMNAIIGFTRLVMRRGKEVLPDKQYANLEKILASANHLLGLINDVLDLSKVEAGRMEVRSIEFPLEPLVDQCMRTVEPMLRSGRVQLLKDLEPGLPTLFSDQDKLRQILFNLLSNAAKFTEAGTITLAARQTDDAIRIAVADTGIGIPADQLELVFEEFRQVDSSSTRQYGGTGLGLSISRRLAQLLGGDITLASTPGVGSTFTLTMPVRCAVPGASAPAKQPIARAEIEEPASGEARAGAGRLVLAIDDDPDVVLLLKENLADAGYRVVGASNGADGLRLARELKPSAITLDIVMPETDGWQVLHGLKADAATRDIPVVLLSVVDQKDLGYRLGAADYLIKPFERDDLIAALRRVAPSCRRLLVVDDEPHVADLVRQSLEDEPYQITAASDGVAALEAIAERRPDVILLDLLMPRMDGFELLAVLQKDPERRDIPVIVLTAKTLSREEKRSLKEHALVVIQKGALDRDSLMAELKAALPEPVRPERREARA
ncbi:MAG TPA: response regulator [Geminicoccaceae bacterium]|nr:response regulator [Geminicoccaceae bacterium]